MKSQLWQTIKSKEFLFTLIVSLLMYGFAIGSARLWQWLIPWRWLEMITWVVVYYGTVFYILYILWNCPEWFRKYIK